LKTTGIAILNWNGLALLQTYLPSVVENSADADVYVIDNASTDASISWVSEHYPTVHIIQNNDNLGYAGGYNQGLKHIKNPIVVLLNSDVAVTPNWLTAIEHAFETYPNMAACQPKIKDHKKPTHFEYAGAAGGFIDRLGYPFCKGRIFSNLEADNGQYDTDDRIFWASGACFAVRLEKFWEVGGLDQDFFAHMEEIDLSWRLQNAGYEIRLCHQAEVFHLGGGTLKSFNPKKTFLNFRNSLFCLAKNLPSQKVPGSIFTRLVLDGLAGIKFILQFKVIHCFAIVHAHFSFYGQLPKMLRKRTKKAHVPATQLGAMQKLIVWQHYGLQKKKFNQLNFQPKFEKLP